MSGKIHCRTGKVGGSNVFFHYAEGVADTSLVSFGRFEGAIGTGARQVHRPRRDVLRLCGIREIVTDGSIL